jgi:hypothetical protein
MAQAVEIISWIDAVRDVVKAIRRRWRRGNGGPAIRHGQIAVALQDKTGRGGGPGEDGTVAGLGDDQEWRPGLLNDSNQGPESAGERVIAAAHRAGLGLADGAAQGVSAAGTGAATTGDFIPINRVTLREGGAGKREQQDGNWNQVFHKALLVWPLITIFMGRSQCFTLK